METTKTTHGQWVWTPEWNDENASAARIVLFRKEIFLPDNAKEASVNITADTRYKLYVNGKLLQFGPSRGDNKVWFVDSVDLKAALCKGQNVIVVSVLRYPLDTQKGNHGMFRTKMPGLYLEGKAALENGEKVDLSTNSSWLCRIDGGTSFVREEERFAPLYIHECVQGDASLLGWNDTGCSCADSWAKVCVYEEQQIPEILRAENLVPRTIPFMYRKARTFAGVYDARNSIIGQEKWLALLRGEMSAITVPAHSTEEIVLDAGEEMTGFISTSLCGGEGAELEQLYAECYIQNEKSGAIGLPVKKDRLDKVNGHLDGYKDCYTVACSGTGARPEEYAPYWYRTFRFVKITVRTAEQPLTIKAVNYEETGYPLEAGTSVQTSDESLAKVWDISLRTLRRCMHETYIDCPYYEQLQYAMDGRQEILYTYAVSADDRLARKCMDDLSRSQRPDGLLNCCYPNCNTNVIPGFTIYYILMVYDHMMYFGDKALIAQHLPTIDRILGFFHGHLDAQGHVGKTGGVLGTNEYWSFIDWAPEWDATAGVPTAERFGPITAESLLYIYGLQHAAELYRYMGKPAKAEALMAEAARVQDALRADCIDKDGLVMDGPNVPEYSQFCQVFALLTGTVGTEDGKANLLRTLREPEKFAQCTIATSLYLFRALEKAGLYAETNACWDKWRRMVADNCTTCIESPTARSECHAWGALALYELPTITLGVRPAAPGYSKVRIAPVAGYMSSAKGTVKTPVGDISVSWRLENGQMRLSYKAPEGLDIIVG